MSSRWLKKTNRHQDRNFCFHNITYKALSKYSEAFEFRMRLRACLLRTTAVGCRYLETGLPTLPSSSQVLSLKPT